MMHARKGWQGEYPPLQLLQATRLQMTYEAIAPQTVVAKVRDRRLSFNDTQYSICEEKNLKRCDSRLDRNNSAHVVHSFDY